MDKALQKTIFRQLNIPVADDVVVPISMWRRDPPASVMASRPRSRYPCFVKPANGGSSIGTSKVRSQEDLEEAIAEAFRYDRKVLVEKYIDARQVETAVLGNDEPEASPVGEITFENEFYDYQAKYDDPRTRLHIPADMSDVPHQTACARSRSTRTGRSTAPASRASTSS